MSLGSRQNTAVEPVISPLAALISSLFFPPWARERLTTAAVKTRISLLRFLRIQAPPGFGLNPGGSKRDARLSPLGSMGASSRGLTQSETYSAAGRRCIATDS